jgi:hypothetical protein
MLADIELHAKEIQALKNSSLSGAYSSSANSQSLNPSDFDFSLSQSQNPVDPPLGQPAAGSSS